MDKATGMVIEGPPGARRRAVDARNAKLALGIKAPKNGTFGGLGKAQ